MLRNKTVVCRDCDAPFVFSVFDQDFFYQMGYYHEPSRCPSCRAHRGITAVGSGGLGITASTVKDQIPKETP